MKRKTVIGAICVALSLNGFADYSGWQTIHFTATEIANGNADATTDHDQDGLNNLAEYALNLNPKSSQQHSRLPTVDGFNAATLDVLYQRALGLTDLTVSFEASDDLGQWDELSAGVDYTESITGTNTTDNTEEIRVSVTGRTADTGFLRAVFGLQATTTVDLDGDLAPFGQPITAFAIPIGKPFNIYSGLGNTGNETAISVRTGAYISTDNQLASSDTLIGSWTQDSLDAGGQVSEILTCTIPTGTTPGNFFVGTIADDLEQINETDETNNSEDVSLRPSVRVFNDVLTVTSTGYADGAAIPAEHAGFWGTSPQLSWSGAPAGTLSYFILMQDLSIGMTHWTAAQIPAVDDPGMGRQAVTSLAAGDTTYDIGWQGYQGPMPPSGSTHSYLITVYALSVDANFPINDVMNIAPHILGVGSLMGTFTGQ